MENILIIPGSVNKIRSIILDILALTAIYFIPTLSHLFSFPVYLIEPLRVFIILSIVYTNKTNAYILALTMPLFSFIVAGHPVFFKMLIICAELSLNIWLFFIISEKIQNKFLSMLLSIIGSKLFYYLIQFIFIKVSLLTLQEVEHPILPQFIVTIGLSLFMLISLGKNKKEKKLFDF
ncbi:MAG: hypothetical protein ABSG15_08280 [FCB group bacterium]